MLLVSYIQQYFDTSITVLTNQVWKLLIAHLFKVPNTGVFTVLSYAWHFFGQTTFNNRQVSQECTITTMHVWQSLFESLHLTTCNIWKERLKSWIKHNYVPSKPTPFFSCQRLHIVWRAQQQKKPSEMCPVKPANDALLLKDQVFKDFRAARCILSQRLNTIGIYSLWNLSIQRPSSCLVSEETFPD